MMTTLNTVICFKKRIRLVSMEGEGVIDGRSLCVIGIVSIDGIDGQYRRGSGDAPVVMTRYEYSSCMIQCVDPFHP